MQGEEIKDLLVAALDDAKGEQLSVLDVRELTSITDWMVVVSGRSDRHVKALSDAVLERARAADVRPIGVEGQRGGEWVLVDFADVLVHVMLPRVRDFYYLEKLWEIGKTAAAGSADRRKAQGAPQER